MTKYKILTEDSQIINGSTVYRIEALQDFSDVQTGDIGGYIEVEHNLSQSDNCWIYNDAMVYQQAIPKNHR